MAQLAKDSGLGRENLYNALKPGAKPRFDTVLRVCRALGVQLEPRAAQASAITAHGASPPPASRVTAARRNLT